MIYSANNDELQAVILQSHVTDVMTELHAQINDTTLGINISGWGLFCQKTGAQIGERSEISIFSLIKIFKENQLENFDAKELWPNLYNATALCVHPAWICTDEDALNTLMDSDPIGYACYCLGILTAHFYNSAKSENPKLQVWAERYWSLARAHELLTQRGVAGIEELNVALARCVSFMPETGNLLFTRLKKYAHTPDQLALLHCAGELTEILHYVTNNVLENVGTSSYLVHKTRYIDIAATPEDAARGPSNVRRQKVSKRAIEEATMFSKIEDMFGEAGFNLKQQIIDNTPGSTAWRSRFERDKRERENEIAREIAALADFSNLALPEGFDEDNGENDIEVRILPASAAVGPMTATDAIVNNTIIEYKLDNNIPENIKQNQLQEYSKLIQQPQRKLSALEMLRAKKGH